MDTDILVVGAGPAGLAVAGDAEGEGAAGARDRQGDGRWARRGAIATSDCHLHTVKSLSALPGLAVSGRCAPLRAAPGRRRLPRGLCGARRHRALLRRGGDRDRARRRRRVATRRRDRAVPSGRAPSSSRPAPTTSRCWRRSKARRRSPAPSLHSRDYRNAGAFRRPARARRRLRQHRRGDRARSRRARRRGRRSRCARRSTSCCATFSAGRRRRRRSFWRGLPTALGDALARVFRDLSVGDIARWGLEPSPMSPLRQLREHGRTPVIDVGTLARIRSGEIAVYPAIRRLVRRRRRSSSTAGPGTPIAVVLAHRLSGRRSTRSSRTSTFRSTAAACRAPLSRNGRSRRRLFRRLRRCASPAACCARSPSRRSLSPSGSTRRCRRGPLPRASFAVRPDRRARLASRSAAGPRSAAGIASTSADEQESQRPPLNPNEIAIYAAETKAIVQVLWGLLLIVAITLVIVSVLYVLLRLKVRSNRQHEAQLARGARRQVGRDRPPRGARSPS